MERIKNGNSVTYHFSSWGDFIEHTTTATTIYDGQVEATRNSYWSGTNTWKEAVNLARVGWPEGTINVRKLADSIQTNISSQLIKDEYFYDVVGQDFDMGRILSCEPECWITSEQVISHTPNNPVRVIYNIAQSARISNQEVTNKGAAILALCQLLEQSRIRTEIILAWTSGTKENPLRVYVVLKQATSNFDLNMLSFAMLHPAAYRRLMMHIQECDVDMAWVLMSIPELLKIDDSDILFDSNYLDKRWRTEETSRQAIIEILKELGVQLKESV